MGGSSRKCTSSYHNGFAFPLSLLFLLITQQNYHAADGGRPWPQYVAQYTNANIYNYAVSGAVCSNDLTPRYFSAIKADFPDIASYELPAYLLDSAYVQPNGSKILVDDPASTVYAF